MKTPKRGARNELQEFLKRYQIRDIARDAAVSSATVTSIRAGQSPGTDASPRKKRGFVRSVVKLSVFADLDPWDITRGYDKIDLPEAEVDQLIEETLEEAKPKLRVGICNWAPFVVDESEMANSWAGRYLVRLIGAVSPNEPMPEIVRIEGVQTSLRRLKSSRSDDRLDLVFGIYETADRIREGVRFTPVPGLEVRLNALTVMSDEADKFSWPKLATASGPNSTTFQPIVINGDVGHSFIRGACGFSNGQIEIQDGYDPDELARAFENYNQDYLERGMTGAKQFPLIADAITINQVRDALLRSNRALNIETVLSNSSQCQTLGYGGPSYRVGLAYNPDSQFLKNHAILDFAQRRELFGNGVAITVEAYLEIFATDFRRRGEPTLVLTYPPSNFPEGIWREFCQQMTTQLHKHRGEEWADRVVSAIEHFIDVKS